VNPDSDVECVFIGCWKYLRLACWRWKIKQHFTW